MEAANKRLDNIDDALSGLSELEGVKDIAALCKSLADRVKALESKTTDHDSDLDRHQEEIDALKAAISGMDGGTVTGDIDTNQLLMRLNMLSEQVKNKCDKADLEKLRFEVKQYTDDEINKLRREMQDSLEGLRFEIERLRAEFENFKNRDFADIVSRVSALEKKVSTLINTVGNIKMPENVGNNSGISDA